MQPDGDDLKKKNIGASLNTIDRKEFHWMIEKSRTEYFLFGYMDNIRENNKLNRLSIHSR